MIKLRKLFEDVASGTFQMYHGGNRLGTSPEIRPSKGGRYDGSAGICFTNNYEIMKKYVKGSKIVL